MVKIKHEIKNEEFLKTTLAFVATLGEVVSFLSIKFFHLAHHSRSKLPLVQPNSG